MKPPDYDVEVMRECFFAGIDRDFYNIVSFDVIAISQISSHKEFIVIYVQMFEI